MSNFRSILVATDFSEVSGRALQYAVDFAAKVNAKLLLMHAYALPVYAVPIDGSLIATPEYAAALSDRQQAQLDQCAAEVENRGGSVEKLLMLGAPYLEIVRVAKERNVDLIVVGTHGRTGLSHAIMGSVAERVIRLATCPVLCVR